MKFLIIKANNKTFNFEIEKINHLEMLGMKKGTPYFFIVYENKILYNFNISKIQDIKFSYHNPNEDNAQ